MRRLDDPAARKTLAEDIGSPRDATVLLIGRGARYLCAFLSPGEQMGVVGALQCCSKPRRNTLTPRIDGIVLGRRF